jgi:hypothetical protein
MSFESSTLDIMVAATAVTDLCPAASIYFGTAPQDPTKPFILFTRLYTDTNPTLDNGNSLAARLDNITIQVNCYQRTYLAANNLAEAVRGALEADRTIRYIMKDQRGDYDDAPVLHAQILQFSCWYQASAPA